jgi:predicted GTPase
VRILVLGRKGVGKSSLASLLLEGNEDVVEVGTWEAVRGGKALRASTYWIEHKDAHGLEKYEAARNVEIVELDGYEHSDDVSPPSL